MLSSFANGTIFGTRTGTGRPQVLALHGWGGTSAQMLPSLDGFDALSLDLPGFGASPAPDSAWGAADYAKAVGSVIQEFDQPPVVLGYSFGGRVAVSLAAAYPERLRALVLTGVPLLRKEGTAKPKRSFRLLRWANQRGLVSDERMEAERQKHGSTDYRNASGVMRDILVRSVNETYEDQLRQLHLPVEMVWGASDTAAPVWIIEAARALMPGTEVNVDIVPGNHFFPSTNPQPIHQALRRRLA